MNRILIYISCLILILLCTMTSCVRDVILDAEEKPTVVVECVLANSDTQELHLNFTKGASKAETEPLTEAVATLIDLTAGKTVGEFDKASGDLWTLDYSPVSNHRYRLEGQPSERSLGERRSRNLSDACSGSRMDCRLLLGR